MSSTKNNYSRFDNTRNEINDHYDDESNQRDAYSDDDDNLSVDGHLQKQRRLYDEQDEHLDKVSDALGKLKPIVVDIRDELDSQNHELDKLEANVDQTQGMVQRATRRVQDLMVTSSIKNKIITIIILIFIIVALASILSIIK